MAKQSLRLAFFLTMLILVAELVGGFAANSLALLSDAGHVVTDIFALGLAWFAVVQAERLPDARKSFGYHRVGILVPTSRDTGERCNYSIPSCFWICSNGTPFVSGTIVFTQMSCKTIMAAKNEKT